MPSKIDAPLVRIERDVVARIEGMENVHQLIAEYWIAVAANGTCHADGTWRALFDSAVAEIAANIIRHAHPNPAESDLVMITLQCFPDRMEAILLDNGLPFEAELPSRSPDMRSALSDPLLDHGWGLAIACASTDSMQYERLPNGSNRWQLGKRLP